MIREDNNARNGSRKNKQRDAKKNMGEIHHRDVWYDGSDVLARICSEKKKSHGWTVVETANQLSTGFFYNQRLKYIEMFHKVVPKVNGPCNDHIPEQQMSSSTSTKCSINY